MVWVAPTNHPRTWNRPQLTHLSPNHEFLGTRGKKKKNYTFWTSEILEDNKRVMGDFSCEGDSWVLLRPCNFGGHSESKSLRQVVEHFSKIPFSSTWSCCDIHGNINFAWWSGRSTLNGGLKKVAHDSFLLAWKNHTIQSWSFSLLHTPLHATTLENNGNSDKQPFSPFCSFSIAFVSRPTNQVPEKGIMQFCAFCYCPAVLQCFWFKVGFPCHQPGVLVCFPFEKVRFLGHLGSTNPTQCTGSHWGQSWSLWDYVGQWFEVVPDISDVADSCHSFMKQSMHALWQENEPEPPMVTIQSCWVQGWVGIESHHSCYRTVCSKQSHRCMVPIRYCAVVVTSCAVFACSPYRQHFPTVLFTHHLDSMEGGILGTSDKPSGKIQERRCSSWWSSRQPVRIENSGPHRLQSQQTHDEALNNPHDYWWNLASVLIESLRNSTIPAAGKDMTPAHQTTDS